jgi:hypothetical protein
VFNDSIAPWLRTPRDAGRLLNALVASWSRYYTFSPELIGFGELEGPTYVIGEVGTPLASLFSAPTLAFIRGFLRAS